MPQSGRNCSRSTFSSAYQIGCSGSSSCSLYSGSGKTSCIKLAEALVEARAAAIGLGKQEPAAVEVVAELSGQLLALGRLVGQRALAAAEIEHRRLQQVVDAGQPQVDHLPGQVALPARFDVAGQVVHVAAVLVPVVAGPCLSLASSTGQRPLERNSRAKLVPISGSSSAWPAPVQKPDRLSCLRTRQSAPSRYQSGGCPAGGMNRRAVSRPARSRP